MNENREPSIGEERGRESDLGNKSSGAWQMNGTRIRMVKMKNTVAVGLQKR